MISRYDAYKDSGIEWIGEIPEHWEVTKVKYCSKIFGRIGFRGYTIEDIVNEDDGAITISPSNIVNNIFNLSSKTFISWEKYYESPEIQIFENDILIVTTGSTIGKTCLIPRGLAEMTINPQLIVLKEIKSVNKFLYFQLTCDFIQRRLLNEQTGSSTPTISQAKIGSLQIVYPPIPEQTQIVSYLDEKTALIDKLISVKQRKIELLKEKRTALINQAVTKGLNPNVKMKDSEVEWIGEIPEHWKVTKLKYNGIFLSGYSFNSDDFTVESKTRVLKIANIQNNGISWDDLSYLPNHYLEVYKDFRVLKGDLVFALTRPIVSTGIKMCFYEENYDALLNQRNSLFRPDESLISKNFIYYMVRSKYFFHEFDKQLKGTNQPNISTDQIGDIRTFVPQLSEQTQIVSYLDEKTKEIDDLLNIEQKKIDLLKEYRQSLISEVVTGKIKVTTD